MQSTIGIAANQLTKAIDTFQGNQVTYTPQGFVNAVTQAGGLPIVLPISSPESAAAFIQKIDKLLLAGGQDISPDLYGEAPHPKLGGVNKQRDLFEQALILEALKQKKPIFAVCRGMQLLNVTLGGTLYQDLSLYPQWTIKHDQQPTPPQFTTHEINASPDTLLSPLVKESCYVNSYHHQAIKDLAPSLKAIAFSPDGLIEAVESQTEDTRLLGVQWHPELSHQTNPVDQEIFDFFVQDL
ncbi:hypothetical protein A5844_001738 [Enterococcus sp. 10A9_DIV0425]|uniref:Uncharacterized protein n=1 Tax=Candidatus Enterococcus wittei TaxID=1987383 RepID=A0A242JYN9_9ENTE|nr:gamma-glutamyl-gamma-aminobutyrate hydrolase family protein [Enterococcus sp. 10A9_DIV0425]OTP10041.1 hypothetical protein A5844_001738 [Enterococcus sp. 10A9_DIV0425]THE13879.1 gamma-glutamyl-gamma-aminobutyrate hydrolase family protein [Enterococcus hirae]